VPKKPISFFNVISFFHSFRINSLFGFAYRLPYFLDEKVIRTFFIFCYPGTGTFTEAAKSMGVVASFK